MMLLTTALVAESPTALAPVAVCKPLKHPIPAINAPKTRVLTNPPDKSPKVAAY